MQWAYLLGTWVFVAGYGPDEDLVTWLGRRWRWERKREAARPHANGRSREGKSQAAPRGEDNGSNRVIVFQTSRTKARLDGSWVLAGAAWPGIHVMSGVISSLGARMLT